MKIVYGKKSVGICIPVQQGIHVAMPAVRWGLPQQTRYSRPFNHISSSKSLYFSYGFSFVLSQFILSFLQFVMKMFTTCLYNLFCCYLFCLKKATNKFPFSQRIWVWTFRQLMGQLNQWRIFGDGWTHVFVQLLLLLDGYTHNLISYLVSFKNIRGENLDIE